MFEGDGGKNYGFVFALICSLFFLWALCNGMIDVLNKHFQNSLQISKAQSAFVQFSNYMGYFLMAIPAGLLANKFGYKRVIIFGLFLIAIGSFWFIPATKINTYEAFLIGLFIIATGLTCLETVANPYTTLLGPPEMSSARINLAQSCNGLGWIFGPLIGGQFILSSTKKVETSNETLYLPYLIIGAIVILLAIVFIFSKIPEPKAEEEIKTSSISSLWKRKHFTLAIISQFLYVAAQTGIFSFFINYFVENLNITDRAASKCLAFGGFGLFFIGRLSGSFILRYFKAHLTLSVYSFVNVMLMVFTILITGIMGSISLVLSFFFMSIMFPTIFALGINGLGEHTKKASSFIVMAIVGGALIPLMMGRIADIYSMRIAFIVPLICFIFIGFYGILWERLKAIDS